MSEAADPTVGEGDSPFPAAYGSVGAGEGQEVPARPPRAPRTARSATPAAPTDAAERAPRRRLPPPDSPPVHPSPTSDDTVSPAGPAAVESAAAPADGWATGERSTRPARPRVRRSPPDDASEWPAASPDDLRARQVAREYAPDAEISLGRDRRWGRRRVTVVRTRVDRRLVRRIDTWTVFKMSFFFYLLLLVIVLVAGIVTWFVAQRIGFIGDIQKSVRSLADDRTFILHGGPVFEYAALAGVVLAVAGTLLNTIGAMLYNLLSDLVGGVQTIVVTEPD